MYQNITKYISSLDHPIDEDRKAVLNQLKAYVQDNEIPKLNFICTHNSRRSHLSQIWAQVFACHFNVSLETFSGGTEATAFNPNAVAALRRAGFKIESEGGENPRYEVSFSDDQEKMVCYSKTFDDPLNPQEDFAAVMTCSEADADCPFVPGASARIKLFYEDPKVSDGTPEESQTYDERCAQIANEMKYIFSAINGKS